MEWMTKKNPLDKLLSAKWNEQASGMRFCKYNMVSRIYTDEKTKYHASLCHCISSEGKRERESSEYATFFFFSLSFVAFPSCYNNIVSGTVVLIMSTQHIILFMELIRKLPHIYDEPFLTFTFYSVFFSGLAASCII